MGRKASEIMVIDGKRYRLTPLDERGERQRRAWDAQHMSTISTRVPADVARALGKRCKAQGLSIYGWLQTLVARELHTDLAVEQTHREWVQLRQSYGGMIAARRKAGSR